jgi:hypothetical protein
MIESGARTRDTVADFFWSVVCESQVVSWVALAVLALSAFVAWMP